MRLSQKCQYAVRAVLELAKRYGQGAVSASEIAASQAAPQRFLEIILSELKLTGLVGSRRGARGGYFLTCAPGEVTVGQVIRVIEGPLEPVQCTGAEGGSCCPLGEGCALIEVWNQAKEAVENVYDSITFQDLADREREANWRRRPDYCI